MVLEILIAGLVGDAIHQEIKKAKQNGDISPSAKNVIGDAVGRADLGGKLVEAIARSILK